MIPIASLFDHTKVILLRSRGNKSAKTSLLVLYTELCCSIVVKPGTSLNDKLDSVIYDAVKSAFVHSCDGLAEAARLFVYENTYICTGR